MEDQIAMTLLGVMEQDMSILIAEEAGSSSALRVKHHRRYVNCDHEAAHLRLHHDYFNDDCDYPSPPIILLYMVPYAAKSFPTHYAQAW
jgi:hypothetical protein